MALSNNYSENTMSHPYANWELDKLQLWYMLKGEAPSTPQVKEWIASNVDFSNPNAFEKTSVPFGEFGMNQASSLAVIQGLANKSANQVFSMDIAGGQKWSVPADKLEAAKAPYTASQPTQTTDPAPANADATAPPPAAPAPATADPNSTAINPLNGTTSPPIPADYSQNGREYNFSLNTISSGDVSPAPNPITQQQQAPPPGYTVDPQTGQLVQTAAAPTVNTPLPANYAPPTTQPAPTTAPPVTPPALSQPVTGPPTQVLPTAPSTPPTTQPATSAPTPVTPPPSGTQPASAGPAAADPARLPITPGAAGDIHDNPQSWPFPSLPQVGIRSPEGSASTTAPPPVTLPGSAQGIVTPTAGQYDAQLQNVLGSVGPMDSGAHITHADPVMNLLLQESQYGYEKANAANEARYNQVLGVQDELRQDLFNPGGIYQSLEQRYRDMEKDSASRLTQADHAMADRVNLGDAERQNIVQGYLNRQDSVLDMVSGLGQTEKRDIDRLYDQRRASNTQNLANRGLGNTTVANSLDAGTTRNQVEEGARLNERLRREQAGYASQLSGDALRASEGLLSGQQGVMAEYAQSLKGTALDWASILGQGNAYSERVADNYASHMNSLTDFMASRTDQGPSISDIASLASGMGEGLGLEHGLYGTSYQSPGGASGGSGGGSAYNAGTGGAAANYQALQRKPADGGDYQYGGQNFPSQGPVAGNLGPGDVIQRGSGEGWNWTTQLGNFGADIFARPQSQGYDWTGLFSGVGRYGLPPDGQNLLSPELGTRAGLMHPIQGNQNTWDPASPLFGDQAVHNIDGLQQQLRNQSGI